MICIAQWQTKWFDGGKVTYRLAPVGKNSKSLKGKLDEAYVSTLRILILLEQAAPL